MDNNVKEEMVTEVALSEETIAENGAKKNDKKKFIIIGAIVAVALVVVLVSLLGGRGGKIKIEGKTYSYSAEEGLKGIDKISDGVVVMNGASASLYTDGKSEKIDVFDVYDGKYPVVYMGWRAPAEDDIAFSSFSIYGDYKTKDGATWDTNISDLEKKGYLCYNDNCYMIVTEKGNIDWDDIEKDYEKIVSTGSFKDIEYIDGALAVAADAIKSDVYMDDAQAVIDFCNSIGKDEGGKNAMMYWLARGKAAYMLMEGEIDYFVTEEVLCSETEGGPINLQIFTSKANAEKIAKPFVVQ